MGMSGVSSTPTMVTSTVNSPSAPAVQNNTAAAESNVHDHPMPHLSQSQRVENKQGTGTTMATGAGEGNAIATTGVESLGTATAVANGNGAATALTPDGAEGNSLAQTAGGGDAEAISGLHGNAAAISRADGDVVAHASEDGNAFAVSNSLGEAKAHSLDGGKHAFAISEDIGNAHAHARLGGSAVAISRGVGNVESKIIKESGEAGNVTAIGAGSGETIALQDGGGAFSVVNRSDTNIQVTNHFDGVSRFEMNEDGLMRVILNGQFQDFIAKPGESNFEIMATGEIAGVIPLALLQPAEQSNA